MGNVLFYFILFIYYFCPHQDLNLEFSPSPRPPSQPLAIMMKPQGEGWEKVQ